MIPDRLVTVAAFDNSVRAALAQNHLEQAGIASVLHDEMTVAGNWALSGAVGGIKLQVALVDLERAEHLLAQLEEGRGKRDEAEDAAAFTTPEMAEEFAEDRQAEQEERNPSNQIADRAFKAAIAGLIFCPLMLYVWLLLLSLPGQPEPVSPDRRWKLWVAGLLTLWLPVLAYFWIWPSF